MWWFVLVFLLIFVLSLFCRLANVFFFCVSCFFFFVLPYGFFFVVFLVWTFCRFFFYLVFVGFLVCFSSLLVLFCFFLVFFFLFYSNCCWKVCSVCLRLRLFLITNHYKFITRYGWNLSNFCFSKKVLFCKNLWSNFNYFSFLCLLNVEKLWISILNSLKNNE